MESSEGRPDQIAEAHEFTGRNPEITVDATMGDDRAAFAG